MAHRSSTSAPLPAAGQLRRAHALRDQHLPAALNCPPLSADDYRTLGHTTECSRRRDIETGGGKPRPEEFHDGLRVVAVKDLPRHHECEPSIWVQELCGVDHERRPGRGPPRERHPGSRAQRVGRCCTPIPALIPDVGRVAHDYTHLRQVTLVEVEEIPRDQPCPRQRLVSLSLSESVRVDLDTDQLSARLVARTESPEPSPRRREENAATEPRFEDRVPAGANRPDHHLMGDFVGRVEGP